MRNHAEKNKESHEITGKFPQVLQRSGAIRDRPTVIKESRAATGGR